MVVAFNPLYKSREIEHQLSVSGLEIMIAMSMFYRIIKQVQPKTALKQLVVTNIKEALPGLLRFLFTLTKEKMGRRNARNTRLDHRHIRFWVA